MRSRRNLSRGAKKGFSFDSELDGVIHSLTKNNPSLAQNAKISLAWEAIASPYIYKHTTRVTLRGSKLSIAVDMSPLITDLNAMSESYREALNEHMGGEVVSAIRFSVVPRKPGEKMAPLIRSEAKGSNDSHEEVESVELSDLERAQLEDSVSSIKNEKLREALLKATISDLEWKKGIKHNKGAQNRN